MAKTIVVYEEGDIVILKRRPKRNIAAQIELAEEETDDTESLAHLGKVYLLEHLQIGQKLKVVRGQNNVDELVGVLIDGKRLAICPEYIRPVKSTTK